MRVRSQGGFTWIELLIVMVVVVIAMAIVVPSLVRVRKKSITIPFEEHFGVSIEPFVFGSTIGPPQEWLTDNQKTLLRPLVAAKIESVCKDLMGPLKQALKERDEFLAQPADMTAAGVADRLKRLAKLDMNVDAAKRIADEGFAACAGARRIAKILDLSPQ